MAAPMTAPTAAETVEPAFGIGDRLRKSREHCGIKSAGDMAVRLNEHFGHRPDHRSISGSTVSAWEKGTNQPTRIRMDELVHVWVDICNEAGAPIGKATSVEFVYGLRTGSFAPGLVALDVPAGQGSLLDDDLLPHDFYRRADLELVPG
jgi:hypothetical protein